MPETDGLCGDEAILGEGFDDGLGGTDQRPKALDAVNDDPAARRHHGVDVVAMVNACIEDDRTPVTRLPFTSDVITRFAPVDQLRIKA